jgi:hypothetical protein
MKKIVKNESFIDSKINNLTIAQAKKLGYQVLKPEEWKAYEKARNVALALDDALNNTNFKSEDSNSPIKESS